MQAFTAEKTELLATYGTDANRGLTEAQAQKNKEQYGENALTRRKPDSLLKRLWDAATEPMLLMLIAAGLIALAVNIVRRVTGGEADFLECVGVFVAIALSVVISVVMEGRSAKAFEALSKINADMTVRAVRDGQTVTLQSAHLAVGDVVLLSAGDKVPADGRLLESTALQVDESALTTFLASYQISKEPNSVTGYGLSLNDSTYVTQTIIIETLARKGPCVIVGRCGDYVLRSYPNLIDVFLCASIEDRTRRIMERYSFSKKDAINAIKSTDRRRKTYYENYTHRKWGSIDSHQMLFNLSRLGMDKTVDIIKRMYERP